jgi:hypothetical protein
LGGFSFMLWYQFLFLLHTCITNFMGHDLAIIVVRNLFFISLFGIDMDVIHLLVLFEHRCCVHCLNMNVICLFVLFRHECCVSIRIVYTQKSCTQLPYLNNAWHSCVNDTNPWITNFTQIWNKPMKPINLRSVHIMLTL